MGCVVFMIVCGPSGLIAIAHTAGQSHATFGNLAFPDISSYNYLMDQDINASRDISRDRLLGSIGDLSRTNQAATDVFDETVGEFLGINRTDGRCLDIVDRFGRITAGQLATESGLTTGAVTAVIDRMEAAGYLARARDPADRRKVWLETTPDTRAIVAEIFGVYDLIGPMMMQRFTTLQLEGIVLFLRIGTHINGEMAKHLRQQVDPAITTTSARLARAKTFRRAMDAGQGQLAEDLAKLSTSD